MIDPFTISGGGTLTVGNCAGIAGDDKIRSKGLQASIYRDGIWRITLSGACTIGDWLAMSSTANKLYAVLSISGGATVTGRNVVGQALETGADGETILMDLKPQRLTPWG